MTATNLPLLKPKLYTQDHDLKLIAGSCTCGYTFFPWQSYGCEQCGSDQLEQVLLEPKGEVVAVADVHYYAGKHYQAPYSVASIRLESGPVLRCLLGKDSQASAGQAVCGYLEEVNVEDVNAQETPHLDLRFKEAL